MKEFIKVHFIRNQKPNNRKGIKCVLVYNSQTKLCTTTLNISNGVNTIFVFECIDDNDYEKSPCL